MSEASPQPDHEPVAPPADTPTCEADVSSPPLRFLAGIRTFESFRHRDYTYFFIGALLSNVGSWMQTVALGWLVWKLTGASAQVGIMNFLNGAPVWFLAIWAGTLADRVDRKRLLIWTQVLLMAQALALGLLNHTGQITIGWIYALTLFAGAVGAVMFPSWQATVPDLVPRESLLNAIALSSAQFNAARLIGPMLGAAVLAAFGVTEVFYANALSFLFVIWALAVIRPCQARRAHDPSERTRDGLLAGVRYALAHRRVLMHLASTATLTFFGLSFATLLPEYADRVLHLSGSGYAMLLGMNGGGALIGALTVASLPRDTRRESIVRWSMFAMAAGLIALSFVRTAVLSVPVLLVMGATFLAANSSINTNLQAAVPPDIRGRVMSLFVLAFMGLMPLGALAYGAVGQAIGVTRTMLIGGTLLAAYAALLIARPALLCGGDADCG
jgi:MFS family permease